jgi:hypothetical protein
MARLDHDWFHGELPDNVSIGSGTWLYSSYAFLHYRSSQQVGVRIGFESGIYDGTFFDLGPGGSIWIGDYTTIVGAIIRSDGLAEIGYSCLIADRPLGHPRRRFLRNLWCAGKQKTARHREASHQDRE